MINLNHYQEGSFDYYENALIAKRDQAYKDRMSLLREELFLLFSNYQSFFDSNSLEDLQAHGYVDPEKNDLESLYSFKSAIVQRLKSTLTTDSSNRILNTCQNCTINSINSFDHFLPKGEFPEFSMNPLNLFPSCTECNSKKGTQWKDIHGNRIFLNLYLDLLPNERYLKTNLTFDDDILRIDFSLLNPGIDPILYKRISYHYSQLELAKRFRLESDKVVTELINTVKPVSHILTKDQIVLITLETERKNREAFGYNYWKSILKTDLIQRDEFFDLI